MGHSRGAAIAVLFGCRIGGALFSSGIARWHAARARRGVSGGHGSLVQAQVDREAAKARQATSVQ